MKNKKEIMVQMFDVRPVKKDGGLDLERMKKAENVVKIETKKRNSIRSGAEKSAKILCDIRKAAILKPEIKIFQPESEKIRIENITELVINQEANNYFDEIKEGRDFLKNPEKTDLGRIIFSFAATGCAILIFVFGAGLVGKGLGAKESAENSGKMAYADLVQAKEEILNKNFQESSLRFSEAYDNFNGISEELGNLAGALAKAARFVPFLSKISSGAYLAEAGKDISRIGVLAGEIAKTFGDIKNPLDASGDPVSFLKILSDTDKNSKEILALLDNLEKNISKVNVADIPEEQQAGFVELKNKLPQMKALVAGFADNNKIFSDILGGNGPRKYLFLFQNNQEMRATGGFIGSYGVLDIFNGRVRNFFIDGIFNPDGQLREKIVPPVPIQKISAAWSLHDSNWFPDFPVSAEKAIRFYEKTGGPTVDGVITMTPVVMQKLLEVTGPIEMPEYGVVVDKDNFVEKIQYEVEIDYDKELNQPKKILADLAPKILDKIFNAKSFSDIAKTINILAESLNEKQILIYSENYDIEKKLSETGWSGEILDTRKDFLSVINTNINGFKTDGVIDEKIEHSAEIQPDGSVVDTVAITRHHNGGNNPFEWWNKVNADYMRVYVSEGSQLLSAEGQTREFNSPPLDYGALGFKRDAQVKMEEDATQIDPESGTRIYEDSGKTVFANWVYVSPQETVVVKYKYLLPFKVSLDSVDKIIDTYSLLAQKQSGSPGSKFVSEIKYPEGYKIMWRYPDGIGNEGNLKIETDLKTDKFFGIAFTKD